MSAQTLPQAAAMVAEAFLASALVVPVAAVAGRYGSSKLEVPQADKLRQLQDAAKAAMKAAGSPALGAELVRQLFQLKLDDDLWYSRLPDGTMVVLVKERVYRQLAERDIVEQVHKAEIEAAVRRGEPVHEDLVRYYRQKPAPVLAPAEV